MKTNEFILIKDNIPALYKAVAVLYNEENNRGFIVYDEGERKENKTVLKIGEILLEDSDIIIEELTDKQEIDEIWKSFNELYYKNVVGG